MTNTTLSIREQSPDFAFDDVDALNADLTKTEIGTFDEEHVDCGRLFVVEDDTVRLIDLSHGEAEDIVEVHSLIDDEVLGIVASHVTRGHLILEMTEEGDRPYWIGVTPGRHIRVRPASWRPAG